MKRFLYSLIGLIALVVQENSVAQEIESEFAALIKTTQDKIEASLDDYQAFLESTQEEKLQLVSQINKLENQIVALRREESAAGRDTAERRLDLETLNTRIKAIDTQAQYTSGVLTEYLTNFESRINIAEDQSFQEPLSQIRLKLESVEDKTIARLPILFEALELGMSRQQDLIGGYRFDGKAITPNGGVKEGSIAIIGPVAYFVSGDNSVAGPLRFNSGTIEPGLIEIESEQATTAAGTIQNGVGNLPLDASLGSAYELKKAKGTFTEHIAKGGWVGYAILILGAFSILVAIYKFFDLKSVQVQEPNDLKSIASSAITESAEAARNKISKLKGPIASMLAIGIEFSTTDSETLIDSMDATILRYRPKLERFLPLLATTAAVAPLMGLLGTVVGMIKTFTLIEVFGTGDAKSLSSGISEALVTTELGLIVAIPALIFHGIFTRVMRSRISTLERVATDFARYTLAIRQKRSENE